MTNDVTEAPETAPAKPKVSKLVYTGTLPDLAKLGAINAALSAVTLGGYYSVAQTTICNWTAGHTRLGKTVPITFEGIALSFAKRVGPLGLAAYAKRVENHERYHMGTAVWEAPPPENPAK